MMPKPLKRVLLVIAGTLCIAVGIIGLALPFLQGIVLIVVGLALIALWSRKTRAWINSHTERFPKIHALVEKTEDWVERVVGNADDEEPTQLR